MTHPLRYTATVYSRPACPKCRATIRQFTRMGLAVIEANIDDYPEKVDLMREKGWMALPLVEVTDPHGVLSRWADLSYEHLDALREKIKAE